MAADAMRTVSSNHTFGWYPGVFLALLRHTTTMDALAALG